MNKRATLLSYYDSIQALAVVCLSQFACASLVAQVGITNDLYFKSHWPAEGSASVYSVTLSGNYAYLGASNGLVVLDISDPASPAQVGTYLTSESHGIALSNNYAYVAAGTGGLQIIDISNPSAPQFVGGFDTSGFAHGITLIGNYAYVADGTNGLQVIDISNPAAPQFASGYDTYNSARSIAFAGRYAYMAHGGLVIFDILNPAAPRFLGDLVPPFDGSYKDAVMSGGFLYLAGYYRGLEVLSLVNPSGPSNFGVGKSRGSAQAVAVAGAYAYLAEGTTGVEVFDISDPAAPWRVCGYVTGGSASGVAISGTNVFVADGSGGLVVLELRPAQPVQLSIRAQGNGRLLFSWPGWAAGWDLYWSSDLRTSVQWFGRVAPPFQSNGMWNASVWVGTSGYGFFRLQKP